MKKLLFSLVILFLPFIIINQVYKYAEYNFNDNNISVFRNVPDEIQVANLGTSHGGAFDYSYFPELKGINLALPSQPLKWDKAVLDQYADRFVDDSVLFILVSYGEIDGIQPKEQEDKYISRYYQFLKPSHIIGFDMFKFLKLKFFPLAAAAHPFRLIKENVLVTKKNSGKIRRFSESNYKETCTTEYVLHAFESAFPRKQKEGFEYNKALLIQLIDECREHKINPVVVTAPVTKIVNDIIEENTDIFDVYEELQNQVLSYCEEKNIDCAWYDYSRDPDFSENYDIFQDSTHLNKEGQEKFSKNIISRVRADNILKY